MFSKTNEEAFESSIEKYLLEKHGYVKGYSKDFNKEYAIDETRLFDFLEISQKDEKVYFEIFCNGTRSSVGRIKLGL